MTRKRATAFIFLDTNLFLQYRDYDQIDWLALLDHIGVCIMVAPIVLAELDKFKYDNISERRRKRSRSIAKKLNELAFTVNPGIDIQVPGRPGVTLRFLTDSPDISRYAGLRPEIADDQLIATILQFTEDNHAIDRQDIMLVSEDSGPLNKARARGISVQLPDESLRLDDEPTVDKQRINELQKRIAAYENQQPNPSLVFVKASGDQSQDLELLIDLIKDLGPEWIDQIYEKEANAIALRVPTRPKPLPTSTLR